MHMEEEPDQSQIWARRSILLVDYLYTLKCPAAMDFTHYAASCFRIASITNKRSPQEAAALADAAGIYLSKGFQSELSPQHMLTSPEDVVEGIDLLAGL